MLGRTGISIRAVPEGKGFPRLPGGNKDPIELGSMVGLGKSKIEETNQSKIVKRWREFDHGPDLDLLIVL